MLRTTLIRLYLFVQLGSVTDNVATPTSGVYEYGGEKGCTDVWTDKSLPFYSRTSGPTEVDGYSQWKEKNQENGVSIRH